MDTGLVLALIAAVSFAVGIVLVRRTAGDAGEAFSVTAFSIFVGILFFAIVMSIGGEWHNLAGVSGKALGMLVATGIIHFIIGRLLAYEAFRLIGANRGTPITQISIIITVVLSWFFLDEKLTLYIAIGALCMLAGVFLISRGRKSADGEKKGLSHDEAKGLAMGLGAALCWGITPLLIKPAVAEVGSAATGSLIAYTTAGIVMGLTLLNKTRRNLFTRLSMKRNVLPMSIAGLFLAGGQLLYFIALGRSPANVVTPLVSIEILFIFLMSFMVNRRSEVFTLKVALGMAATVAGTFLLFR